MTVTSPVSDADTLDMGLRPRRTTGQDLPMLVETLVAAFVDDPVTAWCVPDDNRRPEILRAFFEIAVDVNQPYGELYTTDPVPVAGAVWVPAGCQPTGEHAEQIAAWYLEAAGEFADRFVVAMELMDGCHPQQPHHYLWFLGTRPGWQSRGLGSALLCEVLDRCDREGRPAYLEATNEGNQRLYLRHGFEVTAEITLPDGPTMWPMWREPANKKGQR
jgi:ribosomal protein S18 acetylase RimI-like enzyme